MAALTETHKGSRIFDSMKAAAAVMGIPIAVLQAAKAAGCPAFRSNRVYGAKLRSWIKANPHALKNAANLLREAKLKQEIRRLKIANDRMEQSVVSRIWLVSRIQRVEAEVEAMREDFLDKQLLRFTGAACNVPACREITRSMWDDITRGLRETLVAALMP